MLLECLSVLTPRLYLVAGFVGLFGYAHGFAGAVLGEAGLDHASNWAASVSSACMFFAPVAATLSLLRNHFMRDTDAVAYSDDISPLADRLLLVAGLSAVAGYLHGLVGAALRELGFARLASWASDVSMPCTFFALGAGFFAMLMHYIVALAVKQLAQERARLGTDSSNGPTRALESTYSSGDSLTAS